MASHASNHAIGLLYVLLNGLKKKETAHSHDDDDDDDDNVMFNVQCYGCSHVMSVLSSFFSLASCGSCS